MTEEASDRRLAENEVVFRRKNEKIPKDLGKLRELAESDGENSLIPELDVPLQFYCECSNENCRERIVLTANEYKEFHANSSQFIVIPGHEVSKIERVLFTKDNFMVVEKYETPPQDATKLNPTQQ